MPTRSRFPIPISASEPEAHVHAVNAERVRLADPNLVTSHVCVEKMMDATPIDVYLSQAKG